MPRCEGWSKDVFGFFSRFLPSGEVAEGRTEVQRRWRRTL